MCHHYIGSGVYLLSMKQKDILYKMNRELDRRIEILREEIWQEYSNSFFDKKKKGKI